MTKPLEPVFEPMDLGDLPVALVCEKLQIVLPAGPVHFSAMAQRHAFAGHPDDFHVFLPHLPTAIAAPDYVGQSPHHREGFELVLDVREESLMLVALELEIDAQGRYLVASMYRLKRDSVQRRLRKGHLFRA